jgi:hypothetical protein
MCGCSGSRKWGKDPEISKIEILRPVTPYMLVDVILLFFGEE